MDEKDYSEPRLGDVNKMFDTLLGGFVMMMKEMAKGTYGPVDQQVGQALAGAMGSVLDTLRAAIEAGMFDIS